MKMLTASFKGGNEFKPVPAGTHVAICTMIADMGIQPSARYKPTRKVYIRWEIPGESVTWRDRSGVDHSGPMVIGKHYTLSLSEKANLRKDLESWRGKMFTDAELKGFDLKTVLGKPCMLGVTHNTSGQKTYANVSVVMGLSKGIAKPVTSSELVSYDIDDHDQQTFEKLPGWLQEAIKGRVGDDTAPTVDAAGETEPEFDDVIPF
jgi:hypothetical protein